MIFSELKFLGVALTLAITISACAAVADKPLGAPAPSNVLQHCAEDFITERNEVVKKVNLAFLNADVTRLILHNEVGNTHTVDTSKSLADIRATEEALSAFLVKHTDAPACTALVLKCKPEFQSDYHCYLNPSQSDYIEETITNDELKTALASLQSYLANNTAPTPTP